MKTVLILFSMISVLNEFATTIAHDIEPIEQGNKKPHDPEVYKDTYDYVEDENIHTTAKSEHDKEKLEIVFIKRELNTGMTERFIHSPENVDNRHTNAKSEHYNKILDKVFIKRELNTATTEKFNHSPEKVDDVGPLRIRKQKKKKSKNSSKKKNIDIFYRRTIFDGNARDKPQKWTHCLDLLSPFLNGFLSNVTETKRVVASDNTIRRLSYLLALNMSDATNEEIRAILYEISTIQLRLFQWDIGALTSILNIIIRDYRHDFKGLKYGIKALFASWKLNTSNLTRVLTQSRIFRPPCLQISQYGGTTTLLERCNVPNSKNVHAMDLINIDGALLRTKKIKSIAGAFLNLKNYNVPAMELIFFVRKFGSTVTPYRDQSGFTRRPTKSPCNRRNEDDECIDY